jgi:putative DNA primase/helicase
MPNIEDLLSNGIALVPITRGVKGPTNTGWNLRANVLTSPNQAHLATNMNIGIAHAYCSEPTCAIDLDDFKAARLWFASHNIDLIDLLQADDAVVIHSGKVNSLKLLYKLPLGMVLPSKQIKTPSNTMIVEFRCASANGLTVQDVLPPSIHPSGKQYQYIGGGSILSLPVLPNDIFQLWLSLLTPSTRTNRKVISTHPETPRNIAEVQAKLAHISADCDYFTYRDIVWSVLSTGWTCAEQLAEDWCRTAPDIFDESSFHNVVNSYSHDVPKPITLGTLTFHAKAGGWHV